MGIKKNTKKSSPVQSKKSTQVEAKDVSQNKPKMTLKLGSKRSREIIEKEDKVASDDVESESESEPESKSGSESELESESSENEAPGNESDDDIPVPTKKPKVSKKEETEKFSNAMNALLDSHLKKYDRKDPILARSKKELKKFENDKLEEKAKRMLLAEKKMRLTANRNKDLLPTDDSTARMVLDHEKKLKKVAQRGVIKLFNAILMTQTGTENEMKNESGLIGQSKKKELVNEISKEKFLNLVQQAGKK